MVGALSLRFCIQLTLLGCAVSSSMKPLIIPPEEEIVKNSGDNITLECSSTKPVHWLNSTDTSYQELSFNKTHYVSKLFIRPASYLNTGYYVCSVNDSSEYHSSIYVYFRDPEKLFTTDDIFITLTGIQYRTVVFPCRTTAPDVKVCLKKDDEEVTPEIFREEGGNMSYNPRIGFTLENINTKDVGIYECIPKHGSEGHTLVINLHVLPHSDSVPKPYMNISDDTRIEEGDNITILCTVEMPANALFHMRWFYGDQKQYLTSNDHIEIIEATENIITNVNQESKKQGKTFLSIIQAKSNDTGTYKCKVTDHSSENSIEKRLTVFAKNSSYLNVTVQGKLHYEMDARRTIKWVVYIMAHPWPHIEWISPNGNVIDNSTARHRVYADEAQTYISITDLQINDAGIYTLKVENNYGKEIKNFSLVVRDGPAVEIDSNSIKDYYMLNEVHPLKCRVLGYPEPKVKWFYKQCEKLQDCENTRFEELDIFNYYNALEGKFLVSSLNITAEKTGQLACWAKNDISSANETINFIVTDVRNGRAIVGDTKYIEGDTLSVYCGVSVINYTGPMEWRKMISDEKNIYIDNLTSPEYQKVDNSTRLSHRLVLMIADTQMHHAGTYECSFRNLESQDESYESVIISVTGLISPNITASNLKNNEITITTPAVVNLQCFTNGTPQPTILWYKNEVLLEPTERIRFGQRNQTLRIVSSHTQDEGTYKCVAENKGGQAYRIVKLKITDGSDSTGGFIALIVIFVVVITALSIVIGLKYRKEKRMRKEMEIAGLNHFEEGAMDSINPDLPVDEQAELLPYDKKWEFPRDKLKLGKQLGAGAFGVVMKADAWGILEGEVVTTVAVKMVKKNADYTYIKALASELKIMVHLGRHLNVVNLLGACTKNLAKRELLVIVEFCRYGNLHNYLIRHREMFINQINPKTDEIDPSIGADKLSRAVSVGNKSRVKYAALSFSSHSGGSHSGDSGVDYRAASTNQSSSGPTSTSDTHLISMTPTGEDSAMLSNNSIQPEWRSNYHGDYKPSNVRPICTRDLLCWAFQVARGMEYLASRKVLHGDLAARNILLADDNVVKICDFGLAKSMYKSDNYKKKGEGPLPIKWMAIESIRDRVFSTQSDVWSFGIVLWEFFSLARTPYPGMEADEKLYHKLVDGYRMECPQYATQELHHMMNDCWQSRPNLRPTFTDICDLLGAMLEESVRRHYIDLNDPYIAMNIQQLEDHSDYLNMMGAPTYGNLMSPSYDQNDHHYVNNPQPTNEATSGAGDNSAYLLMNSPKPADDRIIFSPRTETVAGGIFNFNTPPQQQKKFSNSEIKNSVGGETKPMLLNENDSDTESFNNLNKGTLQEMKITNDLNLPKSPLGETPGYFNPNYEEKLHISPTADNYINMTQQKRGALNNKNIPDEINPASNYLSMVKPVTNNSSNKTSANNSTTPNAFENPNYK